MHSDFDTSACLLPHGWEHEHGSRCSCRLLAMACGAPVSAVDFLYCRRVLQKRWALQCDHLQTPMRVPRRLRLPAYDPHDSVHAVLIANAALIAAE